MHDRPCRSDARALRAENARQAETIANLTAENERLIAALQAQILEKVALQDQLRKTQGIAA
jgi:hypothetical protein